MGRDIDLTDNGAAILREAVGNGVAAVTVDAPADLTGVGGSYAMELLDALPAGPEFIQIDAAGKWTTAPASALSTLDAAYDSGGPGLGRAITADAGAVEITTPAASGNNVLRLTQADNQVALFINKSGLGGGQAILIADAGTGVMIQATKTGVGLAMLVSNLVGSISVGDGTDIQGDSATGALSVTSLDLGTNPVIKTFQFGAGVALHVDNSGNAFEAIIRLESGVGATDAKVEFVQNSVRRFEMGYDQSAGLFSIGLLDFSDPVLMITDAGGAVGIRVQTGIPLAQFHVESAAILVNVVQSAMAECRLSLMDSGTTDQNTVGIGCIADDLLLRSNSALSLTVGAGGALTAANWGVTAPGDATFGDVGDASDHSVAILCSATDAAILDFGLAGGSEGRLRYVRGSDSLVMDLGGVQLFAFAGGAVNGFRIGTPSGATSGTHTLIIENGVAPSTGPTDSVVLYSEDVAASAELKVRDEAGNVSVLSPHSEVYGHKLSEDMAWSFYSERAGKYVWVDMLRVVRLLEQLTGEELAFMGKAA
ncbi:MAG: hypothetical protein KAJ42_15350 [Gemmatimonadetes bacterium]|nr:hypothetical protein [Gemmatimonadota bacterium]